MLVTVRHYTLTADSHVQLTMYMTYTAKAAVSLCQQFNRLDSTLRAVAMARNGRVLCDVGRMAFHGPKNSKQLRRVHTPRKRHANTSLPNSALH